MKKSPQHSRKRSRSKTRTDEYRFPPSTLKELRAVIFQFMCSEKFDCPIECDTILLKLRALHSQGDGRMLMSGYSLSEIFKELNDKEAVTLEPISVGSRESYLVVSVNKEKLQQLNREASKDRPKKPLSPSNESQRSKPAFDVFLNRVCRDSSVSAASEVDSLVSVRKKANLGFSIKGAKFGSSNPCQYVFREACQSKGGQNCSKDHFRFLKFPHTVDSWGMCPFPDSCVIRELCKFIHLEEDRATAPVALPGCKWVSEPNDFASLGNFDLVVLNAGDFDRVRNLNLSTLQTQFLILWAPVKHLLEAENLMAGWRFFVRHSILWVKETTEYRSREAKHLLNYEKEYCFLATRDQNKAIPEALWTSMVVSDGSAKRPSVVYNLLDACFSGLKLEIYPEALNERLGWVLIGPRNLPHRA